jgi:diacylglycerol kinase family enzyme
MADTAGQRPTFGQRAAALAAVLLLVGAAAVVVAGLVTSWEGMLVTLAGAVAMIVAVSYVVSRRGFARAAAGTIAVVGLGLVIGGFVAAPFHGLLVVVVVGLALLSVAAARYALRRSTRAWQELAEQRPAAPPAQQPVLIMNVKSGGGKAERFHLVDECRSRGIEPIVLQPGQDLVQLAEDAIARGADVIGMAGGDGSQALVATVAARNDVAHVVVPAGTRNHFALDLGLDRDDVVGALDAYQDGVEFRVDLATVNGRVFVNNATCGLYAKIVQSPEYREAKRETTAQMLPDLIGPGATPFDLRFTGPDGTVHPSADVILVSNNPYELHTLTGRGTRERMDVGVLGIVSVRFGTAPEASRFMALEAVGQARRFPGWVEWAAPTFRIDSDAPVEIGVDGEALKLDPPLLFESSPGVLRVRLPRHAIGLSPAARAVHVTSRSTMGDLLRVIAGHPPNGAESGGPSAGTVVTTQTWPPA